MRPTSPERKASSSSVRRTLLHERETWRQQLQPQLVLMDIYLPDGNGLEVVRQLLEQPQAPDVIIASAARDLAAVRAAMQLGAVHYLIKPFGYRVLAERLTAYQRLHRRIERLGPRTRAERRRRAVRAVTRTGHRDCPIEQGPLSADHRARQGRRPGQRRRPLGCRGLRAGGYQSGDCPALSQLSGATRGAQAAAAVRDHGTPREPLSHAGQLRTTRGFTEARLSGERPAVDRGRSRGVVHRRGRPPGRRSPCGQAIRTPSR